MFTEILRIKPILDRGAAAQMENNLSRRFSRVARRFGMGLKAAIKGTVFGIGLNMLNKLLNPIQEIEERIRKLTGESLDSSELAERLGSTTGQVERVQAVAKSVGLSESDSKDMLLKFNALLQTAKDELSLKAQNADAEVSAESMALSQFVGYKNSADAFLNFLKGLKNDTGDRRSALEKLILGEQQFGAGKRLIETDFDAKAQKMGLEPEKKLTSAISHLQKMGLNLAEGEARNDLKNIVGASKALEPGFVQQLVAAQAEANARDNAQIAGYKSMRDTADGIQAIIDMLKPMIDTVIKGFGEIGLLIKDIKTINWKNLFKLPWR